MKPHRTSLLANAVSGSLRSPAQGPVVAAPAYATHTQRDASAPDDSDPRLTNSRQSTALRERLSQTRARMARAHAERPPQIDLEWDAEEPLTRVYQGEKLAQPRSHEQPFTHSAPAEHASEPWYSDLDVHAEQAQTARVQAPTATPPSFAHELPRENFLPPPAASDAVSTQRERLAQALTSSVNTLRERLGEVYAGIDRSDAALRKRVTFCSLGLLIVAALSRSAFTGAASEVGASESSQAAATRAPALHNASVSISSDPPGALISLDGQTSHQVTPFKLSELSPGRHTISLKLAGYAETKEALNLPADALVSIKLSALNQPRFAPEPAEQRTTISRAEQRAQARELARERRAAARAAKVLLRYRARMGLPPDPVAQELVDAYGPTASAE